MACSHTNDNGNDKPYKRKLNTSECESEINDSGDIPNKRMKLIPSNSDTTLAENIEENSTVPTVKPTCVNECTDTRLVKYLMCECGKRVYVYNMRTIQYNSDTSDDCTDDTSTDDDSSDNNDYSEYRKRKRDEEDSQRKKAKLDKVNQSSTQEYLSDSYTSSESPTATNVLSEVSTGTYDQPSSCPTNDSMESNQAHDSGDSGVIDLLHYLTVESEVEDSD